MSSNMFIKFEDPELPQLEILSLNRSPFAFTKYLDSSSEQLRNICYSGKEIGTATVTCFRADGMSDKVVKYLEIVMKNVIIADYSISGGGGDIPVETITLEYGTIKYNYM